MLSELQTLYIFFPEFSQQFITFLKIKLIALYILIPLCHLKLDAKYYFHCIYDLILLYKDVEIRFIVAEKIYLLS